MLRTVIGHMIAVLGDRYGYLVTVLVDLQSTRLITYIIVISYGLISRMTKGHSGCAADKLSGIGASIDLGPIDADAAESITTDESCCGHLSCDRGRVSVGRTIFALLCSVIGIGLILNGDHKVCLVDGKQTLGHTGDHVITGAVCGRSVGKFSVIIKLGNDNTGESDVIFAGIDSGTAGDYIVGKGKPTHAAGKTGHGLLFAIVGIGITFGCQSHSCRSDVEHDICTVSIMVFINNSSGSFSQAERDRYFGRVGTYVSTDCLCVSASAIVPTAGDGHVNTGCFDSLFCYFGITMLICNGVTREFLLGSIVDLCIFSARDRHRVDRVIHGEHYLIRGIFIRGDLSHYGRACGAAKVIAVAVEEVDIILAKILSPIFGLGHEVIDIRHIDSGPAKEGEPGSFDRIGDVHTLVDFEDALLIISLALRHGVDPECLSSVVLEPRYEGRGRLIGNGVLGAQSHGVDGGVDDIVAFGTIRFSALPYSTRGILPLSYFHRGKILEDDEGLTGQDGILGILVSALSVVQFRIPFLDDPMLELGLRIVACRFRSGGSSVSRRLGLVGIEL